MPLFSETPICKKAKILCLLFNFALPWNPHVLFTHNFPGKAGANLVFKRESWWKVVGQSRLGILQGNSPEKNILVKKKELCRNTIMFNVNLFPKKIKSLKNHERYIVCSLKKEPHLSVPSSSFSSPPGSNLSSQKYAQEKLVVSNPTFFSAFLRVSNKKLCPVFFQIEREEKTCKDQGEL